MEYIAIQEELRNLYDNNTMTFVEKPPRGKRPISTRWVFFFFFFFFFFTINKKKKMQIIKIIIKEKPDLL